jgi:hypothetical protein
MSEFSSLRYQLGHGGASCRAPVAAPKDFLVFDITGIVRVNLDFCGCETSSHIDRYIQLIRAGLYPATIQRPQTAFTFRCLETLHELSLQSKITVFDFYNTLLQKSDKLRLGKIPVSGVFKLHAHLSYLIWLVALQ